MELTASPRVNIEWLRRRNLLPTPKKTPKPPIIEEKKKVEVPELKLPAQPPAPPHAPWHLLPLEHAFGVSRFKQTKQLHTESSRELRRRLKQYQSDLFDDFLPFMDSFVVDKEYGGFLCNADRAGNRIDDWTCTWFMGRGLWIYSHLHCEFSSEKRLLSLASSPRQVSLAAKQYLSRIEPNHSRNQLWPAETDREGNPVPCRGIVVSHSGHAMRVDGQVTGDLFVAEGLVEYARAAVEASGSVSDDASDTLDSATEILLKCERLYDEPLYCPSAPCMYVLQGDPKPLPGARLLGTWMVMLRICTQLLRIRHVAAVEQLADRCVSAILHKHYNSSWGLCTEVLMHDMTAVDEKQFPEYANLVHTGHCIEAMWILMDESRRRGDEQLFAQAAALFRRHVEVAWDPVYGGLFRGCKDIDKHDWILDKALWVQEEALLGCLLLYDTTEDEWASAWFSKIDSYVRHTFPLQRHGLHLWDLFTDRVGTFEEKAVRVGNYHHPRHLMYGIRFLQSIYEKQLQREEAAAQLDPEPQSKPEPAPEPEAEPAAEAEPQPEPEPEPVDESAPVPAVVRVRILKGVDLPALDSTGTSDPLVRLILKSGSGDVLFREKTKVIKKTLNPEWNEEFRCLARNAREDVLVFTALDWDEYSSDDTMGSVRIELEKLLAAPAMTLTGPFGLVLKGKPVGKSQLHLHMELLIDKASVDAMQAEAAANQGTPRAKGKGPAARKSGKGGRRK